MSNLAKINFLKCGNEKCNKVVSPKELEIEKKKYVKESVRKCKSKKNNAMGKVKCIIDVMKKSKYYSLLEKRGKCIIKNCGSNSNKNSKKNNNSLNRKKRKSKSKKKKKKN